MEQGEKKIHQELFVDGRPLDAKDDKKKIQERFKTQINQLPLGILGKGFPVGTYRGFEIEVLKQRSDDKVFQFSLKGAGAVRYPANLRYVFGEEFSLSGFFQRVDNYLDKRLDQVWEEAQTLAQQELVERSTVEAKIGEGFAQEDELELVRRNHDAVIGELKRMQDDKEYVSEWVPMMLEDLRAERESSGMVFSDEERADTEAVPSAAPTDARERRDSSASDMSNVPRGLVFSSSSFRPG